MPYVCILLCAAARAPPGYKATREFMSMTNPDANATYILEVRPHSCRAAPAHARTGSARVALRSHRPGSGESQAAHEARVAARDSCGRPGTGEELSRERAALPSCTRPPLAGQILDGGVAPKFQVSATDAPPDSAPVVAKSPGAAWHIGGRRSR
jgi:hypothetical protein